MKVTIASDFKEAGTPIDYIDLYKEVVLEYPSMIEGKTLEEAFGAIQNTVGAIDRSETTAKLESGECIAYSACSSVLDQHYGLVYAVHLLYVHPKYRHLDVSGSPSLKLGRILLQWAKADAKALGIGWLLHSRMLGPRKVLCTYSKVR